MLIRQLPMCLILHLKRFKYVESQGKLRKLMYRVVFPLELKLTNTTADADGADVPYTLGAVVVHVGSGPTHGHYVSLIKSHNNWLFFDDESVDGITEVRHACACTWGLGWGWGLVGEHAAATGLGMSSWACLWVGPSSGRAKGRGVLACLSYHLRHKPLAQFFYYLWHRPLALIAHVGTALFVLANKAHT